jgi:Transposase IS116/IS110/IS902 family
MPRVGDGRGDGAATLLAETGDPARFHSPRAPVKHAGPCPRDNASGQHQGKTRLEANSMSSVTTLGSSQPTLAADHHKSRTAPLTVIGVIVVATLVAQRLGY